MESPLAAPIPVASPSPEIAAPPATIAKAPRGVRVRDVLGLFVLCAIADVCLWAPGMAGHAALFLAVPPILLLAAPRRRGSLRLLAVGAMLAAIAARVLWQPTGWTVTLGYAALLAFTLTLRARKSYVPEIVVSAVASMVASFGSSWRLVRGTVSLARPGRLFGGYRWVSVAVPIAVVILFVALFSAANPVVEDWIDRLWAAMAGGPHSFTPLRALFWGGSALAAVLLLQPVLREPRWNERLGPGHALEATDAVPGATTRATARNVLVAVNVLFLLYNALDAAYLWAGRLPGGIGYTTYAHRGALWLTVSLAVSTVGLAVLFRGPMSFAAETKRTRILGYVWAIQNLVLAAGTLRRITLYVEFSGLTRLLILGIVGTLLVCTALGLIVVKLARRRTGLWLVRRQLDALAVALVVLAVLPSDAICGWFNAARVQQGQYRPLMHLFLQPITPESIPALASLADHPNPVIRRGVAELLRSHEHEIAAEERRARRWTQWQASRRDALDAMQRAEPRLADFSSWQDARNAVEDLRRLARRCSSSVAKPIACEPLPAGWGRRPTTPLRPVRLRPQAVDAGARVK